MKRSRKQLIEWLFRVSQDIYTRLFKRKEPWKITKADLLQYPSNTFGRHLGTFLDNNNFELIAKVERHDAYHTITGLGTKVEDEIALQYLCYGNGKRSPYLFGVLVLGTIILPDYLDYYKSAYAIGKNANSFYQFDYKELLHVDFEMLRTSIFNSHLIQHLNLYRN